MGQRPSIEQVRTPPRVTALRPVDVQPLKDGSILVSDDFNGAIYRITYGKPPKVAAAAH